MSDQGEVILKVEDLSKEYQLGQFGSGTISQDLNRFYNRLRGREELNRLVTANVLGESGTGFVRALEGVNFEIRKGEVIGVVGKNGAGKSTLLKILSKVTRPSTGKIYIKGKVSSLLEVGTGFHPELTGRENIFLNGAILGMTRAEVKMKLDEIVEFSGVAKYLDTPVKRYSSGMTVRLGFAVAAHLEPDILIVDEVLAVGDAEFQKKAIGKMEEVSKESGRTVLIVSHNLSTINELCSKCILLQSGKQVQFDTTTKVLDRYTALIRDSSLNQSGPIENEFIRLSEVRMEGGVNSVIDINTSLAFSFDYESKVVLERPVIRIDLYSAKGVKICREEYRPSKTEFLNGNHVNVEIPSRFLNEGLYSIQLYVLEDRVRTIIHSKNALDFEVLPTSELSYSDPRDRIDGAVLSPFRVHVS